ncbi:MAG: DUF971 domain-containing protein [Gammaproteobacteria bacterium]|nr:DUF971 domain-containing protein [Gammaproteobacteria bacterium]
MSEEKHRPTEINFHKTSHILEVSFDDGSNFNLPTEYLRVNSPSAEVQGHGPGEEVLQIGKQDVNIDRIEQVGNYAIQLFFDDNHDTGIYSWQTLYKLGKEQDTLWPQYLEKLKAAGHDRPEPKHLQ